MIFNPNIGLNAAALAKAMHGNRQSSQRLLVLAVGTSLGGGMIVDGEFLRISNKCLGDVGYINVEPGGLNCASSCHGCAEVFVAGSAMENRAI